MWKESTYLLFFMRCCKCTSGQMCFTAGASETCPPISQQSTSSCENFPSINLQSIYIKLTFPTFHIAGKKWEPRNPVLSANLKISPFPNSQAERISKFHTVKEKDKIDWKDRPLLIVHTNHGYHELIFLENFFRGNLRRILLCTRSH